MGVKWRGLVFLVLVGVVSLWSGCIDAESGERGEYRSPCSGGFGGLLLCDRENGGADPDPNPSSTGVGPEGPATCASVCKLLADCGQFSSSRIGECTANCLEDTDVSQALLECIQQSGCQFQGCQN